jgi:hypothetical protein
MQYWVAALQLTDSPPDRRSDQAPKRHGQQDTESEAFGCPEIIPSVPSNVRIIWRNFDAGGIAEQREQVWADLGAPRASAVRRSVGIGVGTIWSRCAFSQNVRHQDVSQRGAPLWRIATEDCKDWS